MDYILFFNQIGREDITKVGGKNASLGEMYKHLSHKGVNIPYGFAVTTKAYDTFIEYNGFKSRIEDFLGSSSSINSTGEKIRELIRMGKFPIDLEKAINEAYIGLSGMYQVRQHEKASSSMPVKKSSNKVVADVAADVAADAAAAVDIEPIDVAVRSSSISEDSITTSFAGQQDTYLNIVGFENLLEHIKRCYASLFTDRVIAYRGSRGHLDSINPDTIKMSICVQKMARSDKGSAGVAFTMDTESGFREAIIINASYGLGELVVGGLINPDEYTIFKKTGTIIDKKLGSKKDKLIYASSQSIDETSKKLSSEGPSFDGPSFDGPHKESTIIVNTTVAERNKYCLTDAQIKQLGTYAMIIEKHYENITGMPVDIEWAYDGILDQLFIVQARPVTTLSSEQGTGIIKQYRLSATDSMKDHKVLVTGIAVGSLVSTGKIRKMEDISCINLKEFNKGDILLVDSTTPDWEPIMKLASGIITNRGGRTCHAAIIAREQGIAAVVGTGNGLSLIEDGVIATVSCASGETGIVYEGSVPYEIMKIKVADLIINDKITSTKVMFNLASPDLAFKTAIYPNSGVGLARLEFIINNFIKIHPLALINYDKSPNNLKSKIDELIVGYDDPLQYYVEKMAYGVAKIAAAFYPNDVILRFSDFKSNEYRNLLGGSEYEPLEENPMIGWRGASRYYSKEFSQAFGLECKAVKKVREELGLTNLVVMIPFCRTPLELSKVYETMSLNGLTRGSKGLRVFLMAEIPSNIILAEQFSQMIDGFSIGSNDLTQLVLGLDRDSHLVSHIYDENSPAITTMISQLIKVAKKNNVKCGICGQGPSDNLGFLRFLIREGIDSISITPDSLFKVTHTMNQGLII